MERIGAFRQVGVFLDASTGIGAPIAVGRSHASVRQACPLLFQPIAEEYRLGRIIIAYTVFYAYRVVTPSEDDGALVAVIECVGIIADIDFSDVGGEGFDRFEWFEGFERFKEFEGFERFERL